MTDFMRRLYLAWYHFSRNDKGQVSLVGVIVIALAVIGLLALCGRD